MSSNLKPKYLYGAFPFAQCPARGGSQLKGLRAHGPWGPWISMGPMGFWVKFETLKKQYKNNLKLSKIIMKHIFYSITGSLGSKDKFLLSILTKNIRIKMHHMGQFKDRHYIYTLTMYVCLNF